jgi:mannose-6-phosphate isomerase-like protein (cupin superfamily)
MSDGVVSAGNSREFWTRERCFITELINDRHAPDFSLAEARVEPGITTELHSLSVSEWYVIRRGRGRVEIDGNSWVEVAPGDCIAIPAGVSQRIENTGSGDLIFQCICLPRFTPEAYQVLEDA